MEHQPMTKDEEIDAIRSLVECLGPDSYLGPWLHDALPFLADCITCDMPPLSAAELQQQATADRIAAHCLRQEAQLECRQLLDSTNRRADALLQRAQRDAECLKDRAWQAIRLAIKELEA
jgi:hypothetical protein